MKTKLRLDGHRRLTVEPLERRELLSAAAVGFSFGNLYAASCAASVKAPVGEVNGMAPAATINAAPTLAKAAMAPSSPVIGNTAALSVLGADATGEGSLTYTWSVAGTPPAAVGFSVNATNAAKNTTATFTAAGVYNFTVTVTDPSGLSTTSMVSAAVSQTLTSIAVTPGAVALAAGAQQQFTAVAKDQFGNAMTTQPTFTWAVASGSGSISASGLYTAPSTINNDTPMVTATSGGVTGAAWLSAGPATDSLNVVPNWGATGVPSTLQMYEYIPTHLAANPPIVVCLHHWGGGSLWGYLDAAGDGLVAAADQYGFILVCPQTTNPDGSGRGWDYNSTASLTHNGGGETQGVAEMVQYTISTFHADANRVYSTGGSSGAMMTEALLAVYPDVFKAGAAFAGVPVGSDGWGGDQMSVTPQQWGDWVRACYPGYSGSRPRVELWHGTADTTVNYNSFLEAEREWTNVLGLSTNPTSTVSVTIKGHSYTEQIWQDSSGNTLLDGWTEIDGDHGTNAVDDATYLVPFFNLDKTPTTGVFNSDSETDIGSTSSTKSLSYVPNTDIYTIAGGGTGIGSTSDQFHYLSQSFTGNGSFIARVMSVQNTSAGAEGGVMLRDSTAAGAMFAGMMVTAGQGAVFQWRSSTGGSSTTIQVAGITAPTWVKLVRSGNSFSAFYATTAQAPTVSDWLQVGTAQTIPMSGAVQAGLAVTSQQSGTQCTCTFSRVQFGAMGIFNSSQDVGAYSADGSSNYDTALSTYTLLGSGADIWGTADQFRFLSSSFNGSGSIVARVTAVENTSSWARSGVMFRDSTDAGAMYAAVFATPGSGIAFQWRSSTGGSSSQTVVSGITAPVWVKVVRNGNSYSAYYATTTGTPSTSNWIQVGSSQTVSTSNSILQAGLAVSSHFDGILSTATFSGVQVTQTITVVTAPTANPSTVNGTSTALSVLGAENGSDANLTYTWSATGTGASAVKFSANGTNAAKNTTATFTQAGNYNFSVTIADTSGQSSVSTVTVPVTFGLFNNTADIGSPTMAGSLNYSASNGAYTTAAGGSNIGGTSDQFRYTYITYNVNAQITARVTSVSNTNASAKAGVMFRDSAAANAAYAFVWVSPSNQVTFETRSSNGATASYTVSAATGSSPVWVRLLRNGSGSNQFTGYYSLNGTTWTQLGTTQTVTMASSYLAGLAATSHNTAALNTSVMDNVSVTGLNVRGWATLNAARTTFVADNGQLLRSPFTTTEGGTAVPESDIAAMKNLGFNTIHLYAEGADANYPNPGSNTPGYEAAAVDKIVQYCQDLGLYCIIVAGGTQQWIDDLWQFYAPRYANYSNVIYEIANEPAGSISMAVNEISYVTIHNYAPTMPVLLFTDINVWGTGGGNSVLQKIQTFNQAVFGNPNAVWTNIAYSFHGYAPFATTTPGVQTIINGGYPVFMTEANGSVWGTNSGGIDIQLTQWLELAKVSWVTFLHVPPFGVAGDVTTPDQYVNPVNDSGLSWTPDYGTWPAVRGTYGDGGAPWATTSTFTNNQLTGTLHVEAENYDSGGQGVSYYDTTPGNQGGLYRPGDNVDITASTDINGGFAISSIANGEWFEYTINVPQAGYYNLGLRYSNATSGASIDVSSLRDGDLTGQLTLATTGGLSNWSTLVTQIFLGGGQQILKFSVPAGGYNLNWLELTPAPAGQVSAGTYLIINRASGMALQLDTSTNNVEQEPLASSSTVQQWSLQSLGAGEYNVLSVNNSSYWTTYQRSTLGTGASWAANSIALRPIGNGYYRIVDVGGGLDYEVQSASTTAGALVDQIVYSGLSDQQWAVIATSDQIFPTGLAAYRDSAGNVQLSWTAASGAAGYNVKRATTSGGPYTTIAAGVTATGYVDSSAAANTAYYYVVSAVSSAGKESVNSTETALGLYGIFTTSQDIGSPSPGGSGSYNSAAQSYTVAGGGADIWGTSDQFQFLSTGAVGDGSIIARVTAVQNTNTWAKAGVMYRDSSAANAMFANVVATAGQGVSFQWRSTTGGSCSNAQVSGIAVPVWVKLVRSGNSFSAFYATTTGVPGAANWIAVGSAQTIAMSGTALAGLAVTSHNNGTLCTSTFTGVQITQSLPTVATPATANPSPVTTTTTNLSVLGADSGGESTLTYTWSTTGTPPAPVTFSANGTNAAKTTTATFSQAGTYNFLVSITDASGFVVSSPVTVTVNQVASGINVAPSSTPVSVNATKQFTATAVDQFGVALAAQPAFTWTMASGGGSVSSSGLYTAPAAAGSATVQAATGSLSSTASITVVTQSAPTVASAASASPSPAGTSATLSVRGASSAGESTLTYTWSLTGTPPAAVSYSANGTNGAKSTTATFTASGTYNFTVTITDQVGLSTTSSVSVTVNFGIFTGNGDIGSPTPAGSLSYNATSGAYTVTAGGADIWGTSDQFNYSYTSFSGNGQITAHVTSISNSNGWAKAGPMFRDGTTAGGAFANVVATPGSGVSFQWRSTAGGSCSNAQITGVSSSIWLRLTRAGNQFSAYYSTNGTIWTQVGTTQTVTMATAALAGLAVTSHSQGTSTTAVMDHVSVGTVPTVAAAALASPLVVAGKNAQLTVLGADSAGEANLSYTWSMTSGPAAVTYSPNGTNAAKSTLATFTKAGSYTFQVTIANAAGATTTTSVNVTVNLSPSTITVTPATTGIVSGKTKQFAATVYDQFGAALSPQPALTWWVASGGGSINANGLYTASAAASAVTVLATCPTAGGAATVTVTNAAPTVVAPAAATPIPFTGTTTTLSALGSDDAGEALLTYTWSLVSGPAAVTFSVNGTNAAKNTLATFTQTGYYTFNVTIADLGGLTTTSSSGVYVNQVLSSLSVSPAASFMGGITMQGSGGATVTAAAGSDKIAAALHLASDTTIDAAASSTLTVTGPIDGSAGLTKTGGGKLVLAAANSFAGPLAVQSGTVVVTSAGGLRDGSDLTVGAASAFNSPSVVVDSPSVLTAATAAVAASATDSSPAPFAPASTAAKSLSPRAVAAIMAAGPPVPSWFRRAAVASRTGDLGPFAV